MFDLFRSRAKATRYLLTVLLSLVALSMVITLIPGFGSGPATTREDILAEVGDDVVTSRMVSQVLQAQIRAQQLSPQMAGMVVPQVVTQIVGEMATAYQAREMGFGVSDQEVIQNIRTIMPQLFQGDQFVGREAYQQILSSGNSTIAEFEHKVRQQILLEKLQRLAFDGIIVAPKEIQAEYGRRGEKVRLEVVKLDPEVIRNEIKPGREELLAHLKKNQAVYQVPPKRLVSLLIVDADKLGSSLDPSAQALQQLYDSQRDRWRVPERAKVRHILVKAESSAPPEEKAKAKAKAEGLLKQLRAGGDFAELAKNNSDDPGSAAKGGDLDWIQRDQTVKPFEDTAFSLKPKETSGLVETMFGYHIIQTMDKEAGRMKPLDEVRNDLLSEFRKRQLFERMPALADQARAELQKTPGAAQQIAQKLGLHYARADKVGPGFKYPELGTVPELDGALGQLPKGSVTGVVQTKDNKLIVAAVEEVYPARAAELADVEEQIRMSVAHERARNLVETRSKEFEAKLRVNKNDLARTAREFNLRVYDTGEFERGGQMKDVGPAAYFGEQPFVAPVGAAVGVYRVGPVNYFFKIVSRTPPDPSKFEESRPTIVAMIKERKLRERREMFEEGVVRELKEKGKVRIYDDNIKRLTTSFRG